MRGSVCGAGVSGEAMMFGILATDPAWKEKVRRELALRKQSNIALLRKLGVEI